MDDGHSETVRYKLDQLRSFLAQAPPGAVVEAGVYWGGTLELLAEWAGDRPVYGYDTFAGMPPHCELDNFMRAGMYQCDYGEVAARLARFKNVTLVQGRYPGSDHINPSPVALAHVDVDLYTSTYEAINHLWPLMAAGGRLYCDDALHPACDGATLALCRVACEKGVPFRVEGDTAHTYFQF